MIASVHFWEFSAKLSLQSSQKLMMQVGLSMFFVVLCDDVVCELCARAIHFVSARVRAREKE